MTLLDQIFSKERTLSTSLTEKVGDPVVVVVRRFVGVLWGVSMVKLYNFRCEDPLMFAKRSLRFSRVVKMAESVE